MTDASFRFTGPIPVAGSAERAALVERSVPGGEAIRAEVHTIVGEVRRWGDPALLGYAERFDGVVLPELEVRRVYWREALDRLDPDVRRALDRAAANLGRAHRAFKPEATEVETEPGIVVRREPQPIDRVGVYVPGGKAAYPSSVLMSVIPARIAGAGQVLVASPPSASGRPHDLVLAACELTQVDRVFAIGGAGAIAALAYGTASVPRVDKIVGPGNAYVMEAKLQVSDRVAIDAPAGPSEVLIIADDTAPLDVIAAELMAQAEHDPRAAVVAVLVGDPSRPRRLADLVAAAIRETPRRDIVESAFAAAGAILGADSLDAAVTFANEYAAEHLFLAIERPERVATRLRNTGAVFIGLPSSVVFGDYLTGGNHVLPTGGLARAYSGLSTADFMRWTSYQTVSEAAARALAADTAILARAEGLPAHARAAEQEESAMTHAIDPRPAYKELGVYRTEPGPVELALADNTNLFGSAPSALAVIKDWAVDPSRYPSASTAELRAAIASWLGVAPDNVVCGCGSNDIIDSAMRALVEPGSRAAYASPTFVMTPHFAAANSLETVAVPIRPDGDLDADRLLAADGRLTYVATPNNPTGRAASPAELDRLLDRAKGVVLLDEAYIEFSGGSRAQEAVARGNVLVTRTFSKVWGLAGLRLGYGIGAAPLVWELEKARGPFKVNAVAERAATAAVSNDQEWLGSVIARVRGARARLAEGLIAQGRTIFRSDANFVTVKVPDAVAAADALKRSGIGVRPFAGAPVVGDVLRITVGPEAAMTRLLAAMADLPR